MVQVDVVWSYGLAAGLALAAGDNLKNEPSVWQNRYFKAAMAWIGFIFAPCGLYLLSKFPGWETMFVWKTDTIDTWLVGVFGLVNLAIGALGFAVTRYFIRTDKPLLAKLQPVWTHAIMITLLTFGWDGSGSKRFTYTGTATEWHSGVVYPPSAFVGSEVFWTLGVMAVIFFPTYFFAVTYLRKPAPAAAAVPAIA